jgi:hypothetical protein
MVSESELAVFTQLRSTIIEDVPGEITREYATIWPCEMEDVTRGVNVGVWRFPDGVTVYILIFSTLCADTPDTSNIAHIRIPIPIPDTFIVSR